jgi:hypothetical protein
MGRTRRFDYNGEMLSIKEIANIEGISRDSLGIGGYFNAI